LNRRTVIIEAIGLGPVWQSRRATEPQAGDLPRYTTSTEPELQHQQEPELVPVRPIASLSLETPAPQPPQAVISQPVCAVSASPEPANAASLEILAQQVSSCERCRLSKTRSQTVFGRGHQKARWLLIGEAPGEQEDRQGQPFVGRAGHLLDNMLNAAQLSCEQDVYIANVLKCRPPSNRNPEGDEITACQGYLHQQIALIQPEIILALGRFAAQTLLETELSISRLRGKVHQYQGIPMVISYHPAYLLRNPSDKARAWEDLQLAKRTIKNPG